jgi:ATP-dependent 26S proteasome regulatory subunit
MIEPYIDEEKIRKPRKVRNKIGKARKEIQSIPNPDKVGTETWNPKRAKNPGNFPSPSRILLLGTPGMGKTLYIKYLIMN